MRPMHWRYSARAATKYRGWRESTLESTPGLVLGLALESALGLVLLAGLVLG